MGTTTRSRGEHRGEKSCNFAKQIWKAKNLKIILLIILFIITNYLSGYKPVITGQLVLSPVRKLIYDFILDATVSLWYFLNAILINR